MDIVTGVAELDTTWQLNKENNLTLRLVQVEVTELNNCAHNHVSNRLPSLATVM